MENLGCTGGNITFAFDLGMMRVCCHCSRNTLNMATSNKEQTLKSTLGTTWYDSRSEITEDYHMGASNFNRAKMLCSSSDHNWSVSDTAGKPSMFKNLTWETSAASATLLYAWRIPWDIIPTNVSQVGFKNFVYFHGDPCCKVVFNTTRQFAGKIVLYYVPVGMPEPTHDVGQFLDMIPLWRACQLPRVEIDAASMVAGVLKIPYINPKNMLPLKVEDADLDHLGFFCLSVLNPLIAPDGTSQSVTGLAWGWFQNAKFIVPAFNTNSIEIYRSDFMPSSVYARVLELARLGEKVNFLTDKELAAHLCLDKKNNYNMIVPNPTTNLQEHLAFIEEIEDEGDAQVGESIMDTITSVPIVGRTLATLIDSINPSEMLKDGLDIIGGMDYPNKNAQEMDMIRVPFGNIANGRNVSHSVRMAIDPAPIATCDRETFSTTMDEMFIPNIVSRYGYVAWNKPWNKSDTPGTILWSDEMCPLACLVNMVLGDYGATKYLTPLDKVASLFTFWRGGIKLKISCAINQFATGRLSVEGHYGAYTDVSDFIPGQSSYVAYCELQPDCREWYVNIPYIAPTSFRRVRNTNIATGSDPYCLGRIVVRVITGLQVMEGAPGSAALNIGVAGASDMMFQYNGWSNVSLSSLDCDSGMPDDATAVPSVEVEGDAQVGEDDDLLADSTPEAATAVTNTQDNEQTDEAPTASLSEQFQTQGVRISPTNAHLIEDCRIEKINSLRELCKRFTPIYNGPFLMTGATPLTTAAYLGPRISSLSFLCTPPTYMDQMYSAYSDGESGHIGRIGNMFANWKGDFRWKILFANQTPGVNIQRVWVTFTPNYGTTLGTNITVSPTTAPWGMGGLAQVLGYEFLNSNEDTTRNEADHDAFYTSNAFNLGGYQSPGLLIAEQIRSNAGILGPVAVSDTGANYIEFETPWITEFNHLLVRRKYFGASNTPTPDWYCATGVINVYCQWNTYDTKTAESAIAAPPSCMVLQAGGDNFRYGTLVGAPPPYIRSHKEARNDTTTNAIKNFKTPIWPDWYPTIDE